MPCNKQRRHDEFDRTDVPESPAAFARYLDSLIQVILIPTVAKMEEIISNHRLAKDNFIQRFQNSREGFSSLEATVIQVINTIKTIQELGEDRKAGYQALADHVSKACRLQDNEHELYERSFTATHMLAHDIVQRRQEITGQLIPMINDYLDALGERNVYYAQIGSHRHTISHLTHALSTMHNYTTYLLHYETKIEVPGDAGETQELVVNILGLQSADKAARESLEGRMVELNLEISRIEQRTGLEQQLEELNINISGMEECADADAQENMEKENDNSLDNAAV